MKVTNKIFTNLNLANENIRSENFITDFIASFIIPLVICYFTYRNFLTTLLIFIVLRFLYYFLFEFFLGRTPGKFKTQTIVVNNEGLKPSTIQLIKRNLVRFFSLISGLSDNERALHDEFSNTFVIQDLNLKKIDIDIALPIELPILTLNIIFPSFWIYFIFVENEKIDTFDIVTLIIFTLLLLYYLVRLIKILKSK